MFHQEQRSVNRLPELNQHHSAVPFYLQIHQLIVPPVSSPNHLHLCVNATGYITRSQLEHIYAVVDYMLNAASVKQVLTLCLLMSGKSVDVTSCVAK